MKPLIKGAAMLAITAAVLAAFAGAAIYAAGGLPGDEQSAPSAQAERGGNGDEAIQAAPAAKAAESETVGGWRIEEVDDSFQDDPRYRVVRIEHRLGRQRIQYVAQFSPWAPERWDGAYSGSAANDATSCSTGGGAAPAVWPAPGERMRVMRALIVERLEALERECGVAAGTTAPLLDGFEAAFAALIARHESWQAEMRAAGPPEDHIG